MPHAYTEDQYAAHPLPASPRGRGGEQPAKAAGPPSPWSSPSGRGDDGLFAEQSGLPNPHPRPFSHWEKGGRQAGLRVRSLLLPEAITAAVDELTRDRSAVSLEAANREKQK